MNMKSFFSYGLSNDLQKLQVVDPIPQKVFEGVNIMCPQGKKGYAYCLECKNCSVVCNDQNECPCYDSHKNCENIKRITMFNGNIENQKKQSPVFDKVSKITEQMIDSISKLEQKMKLKYLSFGLNKADLQIAQKIHNYAQENKNLTSEDFILYKNSWPKQDKNWFNRQTQIFESLLLKEKTFIEDCLTQINNIVYYDHMFKKSSIFSNDQKNKNLMLQMLKNLGELKKAEIVYTIKQNPFTLESFYNKCTSKKQLLYVVKNCNDRIYGGYSPIKIAGSEDYAYTDQTKKTFIFDLCQNQRSQLVKSENAVSIFVAQQNDKSNQRPFLIFGEHSCPNLVIYEDSKVNQKLNYVYFGSKNSQTVFFKKKPSNWLQNTNKRKYTLKQFEVYQLTFRS